MRKPLALVAGTVALATSSGLSKPLPIASGNPICAPASDAYATRLLEQVRLIVSYPPIQSRREELGLPVLDPSVVQPVRSDSLCRIAGRTMNHAWNIPDSASRRVYLVRVGQRFWAEDAGLAGGEFKAVFILDSTLTRVVLQSSR